MKDKHLIEQYLSELRRMRQSPHILEAAYDWLSGEIAQIEREMYGEEITLWMAC
ncbi:hypothetical protein [Paenibacillus agilis]|uniref:hypothetical protein n=1 Tax=Paenibacillus agilis TaxID=3020863 RepID=UPI001649D392|nr:hypothetical protein [Paenibacillus agilis]